MQPIIDPASSKIFSSASTHPEASHLYDVEMIRPIVEKKMGRIAGNMPYTGFIEHV